MTGKKSALKLAASALAVFIIAAAALPLLINPDKFRPVIESRLSAELGRGVNLGKVHLSLFSGKLSVDDILIMDNPKFSESPFVTAGALYIGVELMPLIFSKKVYITEFHLDRPSVYLRQSPGGEWNFSDFGVGTDVKVESSGKQSNTADIKVGRLRISNGQVEIIKAGKKASVYEKVTLYFDDISRSNASHFRLAAAIKGDGLLELTGNAGPLKPDDALMTPFDAVLKITRFDMATAGFIPDSAGLSGLFDFSAVINYDDSIAHFKGTASATNLRGAAGGTPTVKPLSFDYDLRCNMKNKTGVLADAIIGFDHAGLHLYGNFDAGGDAVDLKMTLKGSNLPVEELQDFLSALDVALPEGSALNGGTLDIELAVEGTLTNLIVNGVVEITETTLIGFDIVENITRAANIAGFKSGMDTRVEKLNASLLWTTDGIDLGDIQLIIPGLGRLNGSGTISPRRELDFTMRASLNVTALKALTKGKAINIGFYVRGNASAPEFFPDYKDAARALIDSLLPARSKD